MSYLLRRSKLFPCLLFLFFLGIYQINGDFLPGNDALSNSYLPISVLEDGNLSFTPQEVPFMFVWNLETPRGVYEVTFNKWDNKIGRQTFSEMFSRGLLHLNKPKYCIVPSVRKGVYVNTFGVGAGLVALPFFSVFHLITGDLSQNPKTLWYGGKLVASIMVAGSAVFIFLTALYFTNHLFAFLVSLSYALGTCVFSLSSQALFQHGPNEFFLALGTYFFARISERKYYPVYCALAYGTAVFCRPTSIIIVIVIGIYLLIKSRNSFLLYMVSGLPLALMWGIYGLYYLGSPFIFGQSEAGEYMAQLKTGSPSLWQTSFLEGASGLLFSPSRGLMVFSPFVVFSFLGIYLIWRKKAFEVLRPLCVAFFILLCIQFKWFDWWGGWTFGYRPIVDTMSLLCLFLIPVFNVLKNKKILTVFLMLLSWSVFVQVIGAFAFDIAGWNCKTIYIMNIPGESKPKTVFDADEAKKLIDIHGASLIEETDLNIDKAENRSRLWSLSDSQLIYYITNFSKSRQTKHLLMENWLATLGTSKY